MAVVLQKQIKPVSKIRQSTCIAVFLPPDELRRQGAADDRAKGEAAGIRQKRGKAPHPAAPEGIIEHMFWIVKEVIKVDGYYMMNY
jgi:hypothetical protein